MARKWFEVTRNDAERVVIDIYGDIGENRDWWTGERLDDGSVGAKEFVDVVRDAKGKAIDLHVNSAGGSVFDAYAMMSALRAHDAQVTAHVDGLAASAASYLVAAADEVLIGPEAWMMIHEASGMVWGNKREMRESADWLEKIDGQIAAIYARRAERKGIGKDGADYLRYMEDTSWFTAAEAVEAGLADAVDEGARAVSVAMTCDTRALSSAPDAARGRIAADGSLAALMATGVPTPVTRIEEGRCDGSATIGTAGDGAAGQEPEEPQAQERVVAMNGKVYTIKGGQDG